MRRLLPYFLTLASALAAPPPGEADREAAFARLTAEARVTTLLDQSAADIKDRRYELALQRADAALALSPGNPIALNTRGAALTELGRYDEARRTLDEAIKASPDAFPPRFNQGEVIFLEKKYLEAAGHFADLETRIGPAPILKYKLYVCYALAGKTDLAAQMLGRMRYPEDGAAWYFAFAVDRLRSGRAADANELIRAAEAIHPKDSSTYRDTLVESGLLK